MQRKAVTVPARLYVQRALVSTGERPLLLYFHGGGYVVGGLDTYHAFIMAVRDRAVFGVARVLSRCP